MRDGYYVIYSFLIFCFMFLYLYLSFLGYRMIEIKNNQISRIFYGVVLGIGGVISTILASILQISEAFEARYAILTIASIFFGVEASVVSFVLMLGFAMLFGQSYRILFLAVGLILIFNSYMLSKFFDKIGYKYSYRRIIFISAINYMLFLLIGFVISPNIIENMELYQNFILGLIKFLLLVILLSSVINKEQVNEGFIKAILMSKSELEVQNQEIRALYEEMAATEEALQANYDELYEYKWKLEESEKRYERVIRASEEGFFDYYPVTKAWFLSNRFCNIMGFNEDEEDLVKRSFFSRIEERDRAIKAYFEDSSMWKNNMIFSKEIQLLSKDGVYRWVHIKAIAEKDHQDRLMRITGAILDINQRKIEQEKVEFYAFHDPITGFLNEDYFVEEISRINDKDFLVMYVAVQDFDRISAMYGSKIVDIIQYQLGVQIQQIFLDAQTYSHIRAGVFGILIIDGERKIDDIKSKIKNLIALYNQDVSIGNYDIRINLMFPYCIHSKNTPVQEVMSYIEATYEFCKENKITGQLNAFTEELYKRKMYLKEVSNFIYRAITEELFYVVYQPQFDSDKQIIGIEALARLKHPEIGAIGPNVFVPIAEELGIIHQIDRLVMIKAFKAWNEISNTLGRKINLSVNLSFLDLMSDQIIQEFIEIALEHNLCNKNLTFELTETAISKYLDGVKNNLSIICSNGMEIALDDFGTGYSSLKHLGELPVHTLKIDKSFVQNILTSSKMKELVQLMINVGHMMNLTVVAEGIESIEEYDLLIAYGCDYFQGYYLSHPISEMELIEKLKYKI